MKHLRVGGQGPGQPGGKVAALGAPEAGAWKQTSPEELRGLDRASAGPGPGPGPGPGLTEWATPHRNTPISGSAARNTFTFCCTKCFFLVLEAKPKPVPEATVGVGTVAGGTEEDAIVSRTPNRVKARAGRDVVSQPRKRRSPAPPSRDRRLVRRRASRAGQADSAPWRPPVCPKARALAGVTWRRGVAPKPFDLRAASSPRGPDQSSRRRGCCLDWPDLTPRSRTSLLQSRRLPVLTSF